MTGFSIKVALTAAATAALWVVPSIGTQGMGTVGQRFSHADDGILEYASDEAERAALQRADARVIETLAR